MEKGMNFFFDAQADILYFSKGMPRVDVESEEIGDDIVVRLDPATKEVVGFTIINFTKRFEKEKEPRFIPVEAKFALMD